MSLKEAVRRLEASLGTAPSQSVSRFVCEDEGTVSFSVTRPGGDTSRISVCYTDVSLYPNSGVWFNAESASNDDPELEKLQRLSEQQFQEHSPLERVVEELLKVLGIQMQSNGPEAMVSCDAPLLRAGSEDAVMAAAHESEAEDGGSDGMEQDEDSDNDEGDEEGGAGADGEDDDDGGDDEDDEEEREMMISCGKRQGRWERWEERCREAEGAGSGGKAGLSHEQASALKQQIFEPREAFMMLSKELLHILRRQSFDMFVDTVGDNVYAWSVELAAFDPGSNLFKDMQEIQRRHQYSFVKLVIKFKRGLHPFYPPSVEVVRPHLRGSIAAAVASHPMLKLGNWDPWRPVEELIRQIKMFLQAAARVDLDHAMNDITRYPLSSYRPVEVHLARLNALCGLDLVCPNEPEIQELFSNYSHDPARLEALASDSSKKRSREAQALDIKTGWARGTGYGSGNRSGAQEQVWDVRASEVAQRARDEELRMLLESLAADLTMDLGTGVDTMHMDDAPSTSAAPDPSAPGCSSTAAAQPQPDPSTSEQCEAALQQMLAPDPAACLAALSTSCLMPFLVRELRSASFTDMCSRTPFYLAVLGLCKVLGQHKEAGVQLWQQVQDGSSVASLVLAMMQPAKQYTRVTKPLYDKEVEEQQQAAAALEVTQTALGLPAKPPTPQQETLQEMQGGLQLAGLLQDVAGLLQERPADAAGSSGSAAAGPSSSSSDSTYCDQLRPLQVEYIPDLRTSSHAYTSNVSTEGVQPKARMSRLAKEMAGLQQLLPLNECSSVFVRVDEENVTLWRALITGPEDTPYSAGCFIFDFYFPPNYPGVPPQVLLKTTGGGRVRFNPNLYNNGKVCLSLLGTWEGAKGEGWNPTASSALQVLLSIQSLILVPQPYFNEPGYERTLNTEEGKKQSRDYNKEITEATLRYAMIDLLQHPPKEFEAVIKGHFRLRKQAILDTVQGWIQAANEWNPSHASRLSGLRAQLAPLLSSL